MKFGWIRKLRKIVEMPFFFRFLGRISHTRSPIQMKFNWIWWDDSQEDRFFFWFGLQFTEVCSDNSSSSVKLKVQNEISCEWGPYQLSSYPETFGYKTIHNLSQDIAWHRQPPNCRDLLWHLVVHLCIFYPIGSHSFLPLILSTLPTTLLTPLKFRWFWGRVNPSITNTHMYLHSLK